MTYQNCFNILVLLIFICFFLAIDGMETRVLKALDNMTTTIGQRIEEVESNNNRLDGNVDTIMCHLRPSKCEELLTW
jgi:hypothetical protein